jgi:nucleoside-diphosphate-sugar epimerase
MKVFVAGAAGAVGKRLVPLLAERGHEVVGLTRSAKHANRVRKLGARPVVADALDADAIGRAVGEAEPDVVVHQATALTGVDPRHFERDFASTNRLRIEGTDNLLAAARAVGARRFVAQSFAGWTFAREGGPVKDEGDPLDPAPAREMSAALDAIRHLERAVTEAAELEGIVLRYGGFYGPGTGISAGGEHVEMVRRRRFPIVGDGGGVWSFVHIDDVAGATLAAIEHGRRGIYNVVDDEPAAAAEWLPALAEAAGAKPPRRVPAWLARPLAGEASVVMMTDIRGASNAKARRELGWEPRWPSWREGFRHALDGGEAA